MIEVKRVDYHDPEQAKTLVTLLDRYARDPMGGAKPLPETVKSQLVERLASLPSAVSWLAFVDGEPAGLVNAFWGFSTFRAEPLLNLHDVAVDSAYRGRGVSQALLRAVAEAARAHGACKLTLEVLEHNDVARNAYSKFGFCDYELDPALGHARFMECVLDESPRTEND